MPKSLVAVNLTLAALAALLLVYIVRQVVAPMPMPVGGRRAPAPPTTASVAEPARLPATAYGVVATRNLFSPTRSEAASSTVTAAAPVVKPNLFGVVVREGASIAYLEDPTTKRVAAYHIGDRIVGGTVKTIKGDVVTLDVPGGPMEVRLHDPGKPRTAPATAVATPQPGVAAPVLPGVIPPAPPTPATPQTPPQAVPPPQVAQPPLQPGQPPQIVPSQPPVVGAPGAPPQPGVVTPPPTMPGRRPLPPNLLRRLPPGTGDAPQQ